MPRPTKMTARITIPARGDQPAREGTVAEFIHDLIRYTGMTPSLAGRAAGVDADTVWKWIKEGREQTERLHKGAAMYANELRLCEFVGECDRAYADYCARQLDLHESIARGGLIIGEVVEEVDPTDMVMGDDGQRRPKVLKRTTRQKRSLPDAAAIRWNLERKARDEGFAPRVEVTGADGGPVQTEDTTRARALALIAEAEAYTQGVADGAARAVETQDTSTDA